LAREKISSGENSHQFDRNLGRFIGLRWSGESGDHKDKAQRSSALRSVGVMQSAGNAAPEKGRI
jgi:hypothetical protein